MARAPSSPLRVERALRLIPDLEELTPLRALISAVSLTSSNRSPYDTVGKRFLDPAELRRLEPQVVQEAAAAISSVLHASIAVLELEQARDREAAIQALIEAGAAEDRAGRYRQAEAWYACALRESEDLRDLEPKTRALRCLGRVAMERGRFHDASRFLDESLALAEADQNPEEAASACRDLGDFEARRLDWNRADTWYRRGTYFPRVSPPLLISLHLGVADAARERGDSAMAAEFLRTARDAAQTVGDPAVDAGCLAACGRLEASRGNHAVALLTYRRALEDRSGIRLSPQNEMDVRLDISRLYLLWRELPRADEELQAAEDFAVRGNLRRHLVRFYAIRGRVSGRERDETGFVFFEKALELCRAAEPAPAWLEAEVCYDYGLFRAELGNLEESRAHLGHAIDLLRPIGHHLLINRIEAKIRDLHDSEHPPTAR